MKALLLVGSPRQKGASWKLGTALLKELSECGLETESLHLAFCTGEAWGEAERSIASADLLILSLPVYVDSIPAPAIAALERLVDRVQGKWLAVVLNCGFPEGNHNNTALKICRQFAREAGCRWLGGLALSMAGFSFGSGPSRRVARAMAIAAPALAQGEPVPKRAVKLAAKRPMPKWLYLAVLNWNFRKVAAKRGKAPINHQPYL
ncbi:MAG: NAD(P)H-dependent oxidoreductase [Firmicutes bacterium]|nr:NAD(P)H-dependent oxidoreductase [Bacillota bacterium]